jgi:hypothetical protein
LPIVFQTAEFPDELPQAGSSTIQIAEGDFLFVISAGHLAAVALNKGREKQKPFRWSLARYCQYFTLRYAFDC